MSDKNVKLNEKVFFVFGQRWCWGLILLAIFLISFSNTLLIVLWPKQQIVVVHRDAWGADPALPGLTALELPVDHVIITDTGDEAQSCTTKVSFYLPQF
jgi:hypothetical protein